MKRPKGAAVSGEIRVREEGKIFFLRGTKEGRRRRYRGHLWLEAYHAVPCRNQFRAAANKPTAQLGTLCPILQAFKSILNDSEK